MSVGRTAGYRHALTDGANGIPKIESYVLGLDPKVATSIPVAQPVQTSDADKLTLTVGGIEAPSFSRQPDKPMHALGMPAASLSALFSGIVTTTAGVARVSDGVRLFGPIPRIDPLEHVRGFFYDETCTMPSRVPEEQALLTDDGVLVTGCCHAGIVNTVECIRSLAPEIRIRAIVGGLHLCWTTNEQVVRVTDYLNRLGLERLVLLHCTGEAASAYLLRHMQCPVSVGASGETWNF